jgi:hypothetical protein
MMHTGAHADDPPNVSARNDFCKSACDGTDEQDMVGETPPDRDFAAGIQSRRGTRARRLFYYRRLLVEGAAS